MKPILFLISISVFTNSFSQQLNVERKVVPIITEQKFVINSQNNATLAGGKSKISIMVQLPENTVEWYYVYSASINKDNIDKATQSINLVAQLTKIFDPTGITSTAVSSILAPSGSNECDIYLLSSDNRTEFINGRDTLP
jgi:hypothetical protein